MNIFATDPDPRKSAIALDDRRVIKMALESAQMLSTACRFTFPDHDDGLYRVSHYNHPCSVWCRRDVRRFLWLYDHGVALCMEYQSRYGRTHKSLAVIDLAYRHLLTFGDRFPETSDELVFDFNSSGFDTGSVFDDYRLCMLNKWVNKDTRRPTWTDRDKPSWYLPTLIQLEGMTE